MKTIPSLVKSVVLSLALAVASAIIVPRAAYAQEKIIAPDESALVSDHSEAKEMFAVVGEPYKARIAIAAEENEDRFFRVTYASVSYAEDGTPTIKLLSGENEVQIDKKNQKINVLFTPTPEMGDKSVLVRVQLLDKKGGKPVSPGVEGYGVVAVKPTGFTGTEAAQKEQRPNVVKSPIGVGRR